MISTIAVHQVPGSTSTLHPAHRVNSASTLGHLPTRKRTLNLQFLDLTDCQSLEDSGLKMILEACPQLLYLFLRRCQGITGKDAFPLKILVKES